MAIRAMRSPIDCRDWNAANEISMNRNGARIANRIFENFAICADKRMQSPAPMRFAKASDQTMV